IGVGLLPEGLLAPAEQVVEQRSNIEGQGISVEVVVQGVVAVFGIERNFDVVFAASAAFEDLPHAMAKVPFNLKDQSADPRITIIWVVAEDLLGEGIQAGGRFATADGAENGDSREESAFRNDEPRGCSRRARLSRIMNLADDEEQVVPFAGIRV